MLGQRLGVVSKLARRLAVELHNLATQLAQQARDHYTAHGIDRIDHHAETTRTHRFDIDSRQGQHTRDMLIVIIRLLDQTANRVNRRVLIINLFSHSQHAFPFGIGEELACSIQQFEGIPLTRIVRRGDDDTAIGLLRNHGHLRTGRGTKSDVDHIHARGQQRTDHQIGDQFARQTGISAHHNPHATIRIALGHQPSISRRKFHNINRGQVLALHSANRTADTRYGFNQGHIWNTIC